MKITVWTSWDTTKKGGGGEPKCIFDGEISAIPRADDYITVRNGFGAERVVTVCFDAVDDDVEITVATADRNNDYGPCLRSG